MGRHYIHETARLLGLSDQALRFFEKKKVITARRDDRGYRYYDENDIGRLLAYQNLRSCGFTMEETLKLLDIENEESAARNIEEKMDSLRQQIRHMEASVDYLKDQQEKLLECAGREVRLKRETRPEIYGIPACSEHTRAWLEAMPVVRSAMLLPLNHRDNLDLDILYILEAQKGRDYGLEHLFEMPDVQNWKPQVCLHGMFWLKRAEPGAKGVIQTYLDDRGILRTGPVLFYPVWQLSDSVQGMCCSEAWIPVE